MKFIHKHIEWFAFAIGLILLAFMSPENAGTSFCLFDLAGIEFCPGEGLGHSISYTFRGDLSSALSAHLAGPFAVVILIGRICYIWKNLLRHPKTQNSE
ncbi:DUF2752 domain-containing protein [Gracilimonas sp.]|uniref:DUF2752 domain-containing protein n=1 Tax=Gracilimonas sp. TaxID=1974203 RepID=UPI002870BE59|nr:DUF2752 domain-containing protein [Gracilimonas sp.]